MQNNLRCRHKHVYIIVIIIVAIIIIIVIVIIIIIIIIIIIMCCHLLQYVFLLFTACPCVVIDVHLQVTLAFCLNADGVADICPDAPVDEYEPPIEDPTEVRLAHSAVSGLVLRVPIGLLDV